MARYTAPYGFDAVLQNGVRADSPPPGLKVRAEANLAKRHRKHARGAMVTAASAYGRPGPNSTVSDQRTAERAARVQKLDPGNRCTPSAAERKRARAKGECPLETARIAGCSSAAWRNAP
eukprot:6186451-Pleurochrysis_carterae.AAC.1